MDPAGPVAYINASDRPGRVVHPNCTFGPGVFPGTVALYANGRALSAGEELLYDYGPVDWSVGRDRAGSGFPRRAAARLERPVVRPLADWYHDPQAWPAAYGGNDARDQYVARYGYDLPGVSAVEPEERRVPAAHMLPFPRAEVAALIRHEDPTYDDLLRNLWAGRSDGGINADIHARGLLERGRDREIAAGCLRRCRLPADTKTELIADRPLPVPRG